MSKKKKEEQSTRLRLAQDLAAVNDPALNELIERAEAGYYDDYDTPLATPQTQLSSDLRGVIQYRNLRADGDDARREMLETLFQAAMDGGYEATDAEVDAWMERKGYSILQEGFRSDEKEGKAHFGAADLPHVSYLTRRLMQSWRLLLDDKNLHYSRMDMMMAVHNFHAWAVVSMLEEERDDGLRRQFFQSQ